MPLEQSTWLISAPQDGDTEGLLHELGGQLEQQVKAVAPGNIAEFDVPSFKVYSYIHFDATAKFFGRKTY